jgi:predicted enzyme related to lactoylglutathione lyase
VLDVSLELGGVLLFVKDFERMVAFYRDVVGLAEVPTQYPGEYQSFDTGSARLSLHALPEQYATDTIIEEPPRIRDTVPAKFIFRVADVEGQVAQLREKGVITRDAVRFDALVLCDVIDPEGNVFQLSNR